VLNSSGNSSQSLKKAYFLDYNEVSTSSFESVMLEDSYTNIQVPSHNVRKFISLSAEYVVMGIRHSGIDTYLNDLFVLFNSLAFTTLALVFLFHGLSLSSTLITTGLNLSHHPWTHLHNFHSDTISLANFTLHRIAAPFTIAISAYSISGDCHILHCSSIYLFQGYLHFH
jgi:hypothetical protein